ncbi:MAG: tRNA (adenosine(37)-N6)-dimethylallyltransferase MiaA [Paludibacteraceae bacterium]|nr:tRNA (adenosine(37)-N6)-dimethylallyltransferase MiaA [Paludibacteraceae bacterium]
MKTLLVLLGPTAVGKTRLSLTLAQRFHCPVISADSRQIYRGIEIGTAAPTPEERALVQHFFIGTKDLQETYSAGQYELDAMDLLQRLFVDHDYLLVTGGSMMYIDALCRGMDDIPRVPDEVRARVHADHARLGLPAMLERLRQLDPVRYRQIDPHNTQRILHAIEVSEYLGRPYSSILKGTAKQRPFRIVKIGLDRPREELFARINQRVEEMMRQGLLEEARRVYPLKGCNSLQTVGYRELFDFMDGKVPSLEEAVRLIQRNTRRYAKHQLTWFRRDAEVHWFHPDRQAEILQWLDTLSENVGK